ncbi:MAG: hypothetical protein M0R38_11465 [Bacteroidia bacterium]|nr:hypothetical protein [Bacteroidia bacterium]
MDNKELIEKYPFLQVRNAWSGEIIENTTWYDQIPEGWRKNFGLQMIEEISQILKKANFENDYQIVQIKEKYAELRWYDNGAPEEIYQEIQNCINKYMKISEETCIFCGEKADGFTYGWILPICNQCSIEKNFEIRN